MKGPEFRRMADIRFPDHETEQSRHSGSEPHFRLFPDRYLPYLNENPVVYILVVVPAERHREFVLPVEKSEYPSYPADFLAKIR